MAQKERFQRLFRLMMKKIVTVVVVIALCLHISATTAEAAGYSGSGAALPQIGRINLICPTTLLVQNPLGFYFFSLMIPCLQKMIVAAGKRFVDKIYPVIARAIRAAVTLAIIIFGILLMTQAVERLHRDSFIFMVKVCVVIAVTANMKPLLDLFYQAQDGLIEIVTGFSGFFTGLKCPLLPSNLFGIYSVWFRADCIINIIIGIGAPKTLANGLLAFFFNSLMTGGIMIGVAIVGMYMSFNVVMGLLKATKAYILCVTALTLLAIVGGIFIPLMLFKNTFGYYKSWVKNVLGVIIQPMIMFAFLNVMISAFDNSLYSGQYSIMRTLAGNAVDAVAVSPGGINVASVPNIVFGFNLNDYMAQRQLYIKEGKGYVFELSPDILLAPAQTRDVGAAGEATTPQQSEAARASTAAGKDARDFRVMLPFDAIDIEKMANARNPAVEASGANGSTKKTDFLMEIAGAFALAWLTSYIFVAAMEIIPQMSNKLSGSSLHVH